MMWLLTERWLTPGSFTAFRAAWEPQRQPEQLVRAYHLRDQGDPDHIDGPFPERILGDLPSGRVERRGFTPSSGGPPAMHQRCPRRCTC